MFCENHPPSSQPPPPISKVSKDQHGDKFKDNELYVAVIRFIQVLDLTIKPGVGGTIFAGI